MIEAGRSVAVLDTESYFASGLALRLGNEIAAAQRGESCHCSGSGDI